MYIKCILKHYWFIISKLQWPSLSLNEPLAEHLMHTAHFTGNTSIVLKSSSDWLKSTEFLGDVHVAFFNVPSGNKDAMAPNPLIEEHTVSPYTDWLHHFIGLISTNKLVCGGRSGAQWLPSHHPSGCCTLVVDEEIPPYYVKCFEYPEKRYINVRNYYYY